ncbi:MAG: methyltransferase domain-containing protein [Lachnospiraceae bacterium]|nr:methyltransferase domain-containing protein [Lachnospiraceae bacterium]
MLEKMDVFFENRLIGYDEHMLTTIEGADEFYTYTAHWLPTKAGSRVLDLGCGTGLELEAYFPLNPHADITGIDLSDAMLHALAEKFPDKALTLIHGSYFDIPFEAESYHAAVSVESLHHFTAEQKLALYRKLAAALKPDGYFILTDYFAESEAHEKEYFDTLNKLKQEQHITDDAFYHYDTPLTVEHEIRILTEAGFCDVRILKNWNATYTLRAARHTETQSFPNPFHFFPSYTLRAARQTEKTHAQRSIRHCLDMLAPFAPSAEHKEGPAQFYQLMVSIYHGMYESPEAYLVFPAPYEAYLQKRQNTKKGKEKEHATDARESTLRNTFQQAIQFYASYFYHLGLQAKGIALQSGALIVSKEDYAGVLNQMNRIHESHYNAERYDVLGKLGIDLHENGDTIEITHKTYPHAMAGLLYLCQAPDSKYKWMNFLRLDFKNAYSPIPTVDDICKTLPPKSREVVKKLENSLSSMKIKAKIKPLRGIVSDFKWKVEYSYKGKNICGFYADNAYFMLCIYFNDFHNINAFAKLLYEENRDLFEWFQKQFPERLCSCPSNRRVCFGSETRRICGLSNRAEIVSPDDADMENALYVLKKYHIYGKNKIFAP